MRPLPLVALLVQAMLLLGSPCAIGQTFPAKPIRIIVPFPPGSSGDLNTREIAPFVSEQLKQQVVIDNRPGAGGSIGSEQAARAPADGYTVLFMVSTTLTVNPHLYDTPNFRPTQDLRPFIITLRTGAFVVVRSDSRFQSLQELIAAARTQPGTVTYATSGPGSPQHLMGERLKRMSGADLLQVAYKGETFALTDLMGGQVDVAFGFAIGTFPHIRSGRLRPLAYTAAQRSSALPQVPTVAEAGVPGYEELVWVGFGVPAATPAPIVDRLHQAFYAAATTPAYRRLVEARGGEPVASSADEAVALLKSDFDRYRGVVKELGLRYDR